MATPFADLFPTATVGDQRDCDGDSVLLVGTPGPCAQCQRETEWLSVSFGARFCSRECLEQSWGDYFDAEVHNPEVNNERPHA